MSRLRYPKPSSLERFTIFINNRAYPKKETLLYKLDLELALNLSYSCRAITLVEISFV
jgi:hypothetical protein